MPVREKFPDGVAARLKWYVYRLIDPRNGETFYVGKGHGNRIFAHAKGVNPNPQSSDAEDTEDAADLKLKRIQDIKSSGLEVGHVVHRHAIESEAVAYEVEAALIDAYPGLTNSAGGHGSSDYGSRHVEEIIADYALEPFEVKEKLVLISITKSFQDEHLSTYEAVRCSWRMSLAKAKPYKLVLAHVNGRVVGAFRVNKWLPSTPENFPGRDVPGRFGFHGQEADSETWRYYVNKIVPDTFRRRGAANPVRYCDP